MMMTSGIVKRYSRQAGIAAVIAIVFANASAITQEEVSAAMSEAIKRDLGLSEQELAAYLAKEQLAMEVGPAARADLGSDYAGHYLKRNADNTSSLIVLVKDTSTKTSRYLARADEVQRVPYSMQELNDALEKLTKTSGDLGLSHIVYTIGVDTPGNQVELTVAENYFDTARVIVSGSGVEPDMVRIVTSTARSGLTLKGGDKYLRTQYAPYDYCSTGFSAYNFDSSAWGFLTAGHCLSLGDDVWAINNDYLGETFQRTFPGSDYAWVWILNVSHPGEPYVNRYGTSDLSVYGNQELPYGAYVCRSGGTTGYRCGTITATSVNIYYVRDGVWVNGVRRSTACTAGGDSGGATFSAAGEAQGIHSGGSFDDLDLRNNCSEPSPASYYVPLQTALNGNPNIFLRVVESPNRMTAGYQIGGSGVNVRATTFQLGPNYRLSIIGGFLNYYGAGSSNNLAYVGSGGYLRMQPDGNLVARNNGGTVVWSTGTYSPGSEARLDTDHTVDIYDPSGLRIHRKCLLAGGACGGSGY